MTSDKWFEAYDGQTTDDLLGLDNEYRIDSLVLAFEEAIQQKPPQEISKAERYILAIEALEREVNNGGYSQFFFNSSNEFVDVIEEALLAIGCPKTAAITRDAIIALGVKGEFSAEKAEAIILAENEAVLRALNHCDDRYYDNDEPIAGMLFTFIKDNRTSVRIGDA